MRVEKTNGTIYQNYKSVNQVKNSGLVENLPYKGNFDSFCKNTNALNKQTQRSKESFCGAVWKNFKNLTCQNSNISFAGNISETHKISKKALVAGTSSLSEPKTAEYEAIKNIVDECFVYIKDKEEVLKIFKKHFDDLSPEKDADIFVLNPQNQKNVAKKIGTSNAYMTEWYALANGLEDKTISGETIEKITNSNSDKVIIIVPDDCAITGRTLVVETARTLNEIDFPEEKSLEIVFSPLIGSKCAKEAFSAMADFNLDRLAKTGILSQNDFPVVQKFFDKYSNHAKISLSKDIIEAKRYQETECYRQLTKENPELAQAVEAILTSNGTRNGFGRPGTSGVMIATPSSDGVSLKCPNNNVFGAAPYALALGAKPTTIKRPSQKVGVKKWQTQLEAMLIAVKSYLK